MKIVSHVKGCMALAASVFGCGAERKQLEKIGRALARLPAQVVWKVVQTPSEDPFTFDAPNVKVRSLADPLRSNPIFYIFFSVKHFLLPHSFLQFPSPTSRNA